MSSLFGTIVGAVASSGAQHLFGNVPTGPTPYVPYEAEGLSLLIQLGILANYDGSQPPGTLIGFKEYEIEYFKPTPTQGLSRYKSGANYSDLGNLPQILIKCVQRISSPDDKSEIRKQISVIIKFAIKGLEELRKTYEIHSENKPQKKFNVTSSINTSIQTLRNAIDSPPDHNSDTPTDIAVRENYRDAGDITYVANIITRLSKPGNSTELNQAYVGQLESFIKAKICEYKIIKQSKS